MLPGRSSERTGAMKRSSAIWMSAAPSAGSSDAHCAPVSTWPPFTATISPAVMAVRVKRPWPWIGLGRTSVFGERYVRSAMGGERPDEGVGLVGGDQPGPLALPLDPHEAVRARDEHPDQSPLGRPQVAEGAEEPAGADPHAPPRLAPQHLPIDDAHRLDVAAGDLLALERPGDLDGARVHHECGRTREEPDPGVDHEDEERGREQERRRPEGGQRQEDQGEGEEHDGEDEDLGGHRGQTIGHDGSELRPPRPPPPAPSPGGERVGGERYAYLKIENWICISV